MAGVLETFFIMFEADASKLQEGLKDAQKEGQKTAEGMQSVDKAAERVGDQLMKTAKNLLGVLGIGASVAAFAAGIEHVAAYNVELTKLAAKFKATNQEMNAYLEQNKLIGISSEKAKESLEGLNRSIQDTAMGMGRGAKVYEELGIAVKDAHGNIKPTMEVLGELQAKFKGMDTGKKIRIMERLGLDPSMLKMFNADMGDLNKRIKAIDDATGYSLQTATKNSAEFTKAQKELKLEGESILMYFEKLGDVLMINAMPFFTDLIKKASEVMHGFFNFITEHGHLVKGALIGVGIAIGAYMIPSLYGMATAAWAALVPFILLNLPIIGIGLAVMALIGVFALLYDDIMTFSEGGQSLIGEFFDYFGVSVEEVKETWNTVWEGIKTVFHFVMDFMTAYWGKAYQIYKTIIGAYIAVWKFLINAIVTEVKFLWGVLVALWDFAKDMWNNPSKALDNFLKKIGKLLPSLDSIKNILASIGIGSGAESEIDKKKKIDAALEKEAAQKALAQGKIAITQATKNPITSQTSSSIHSQSSVTKNNNVTVSKIEINAQGADANQLAGQIHGALNQHAKEASAQYDDGILF